MSGLRRIAKKAAASSPALRKMARRWLYTSGMRRYRRVTAGIATDPKKILFSSYNGVSYSCSPKALYEHMLADGRFDGCTFVWAFKDPDAHLSIADEARTSVVGYGSDGHLKALRASKCWVDNSRVFEYVWPASDQIYVQCWHGTPLKRLGFDLEFSGSRMNDVSEFRRKYRLDAEKFKYMVSPSPFTTEVFASAFDLAGLGKTDALVEIGYPRNDALFAPSAEDIAAARARIGLRPEDNRNVLLYAPTFRDYEYTAGGEYGNGVMIDFDALKQALGDGYVVLLRTHYLVSSGIDFAKYGGFAIDCTAHDDVNDLFLAADMLLCDYSSLFFDYADLGKPIVFFMPDLEKYEKETRGFYINIEELPGEIVRDAAELPGVILRTLQGFGYNDKYRRFHEKFGPLDDGRAAGRLADIVAGEIIG
ncbi:MAG: CDP-glycerol glycerophosphotransferase family protein [Clostridiales Family XIII bacterium]|jgi:CDP-glycerol glycerophosphotransferase|nr:CDP-glycerol glycerophosphotransferase family protein [Clostridiales Family XIII bacterium]